jgi:hypothetical protein
VSLKGKTQEFYNPLGPPFQIPMHKQRDLCIQRHNNIEIIFSHVVWLWFDRVYWKPCVFPIPVKQTTKFTEFLCFSILCFALHVQSLSYSCVFSYSFVFRIFRTKQALQQFKKIHNTVDLTSPWAWNHGSSSKALRAANGTHQQNRPRDTEQGELAQMRNRAEWKYRGCSWCW